VRVRLNAGLRQIAFFVIPSVAAFLVLGDVIVAAIYQSGRFTHTDATYVWGILADRRWACLPPRLPALFLHVLRFERYSHAAALRRPASHPDHLLGYLSAIPLPHLLGIASAGASPDSRFQRAFLPGLSHAASPHIK